MIWVEHTTIQPVGLHQTTSHSRHTVVVDLRKSGISDQILPLSSTGLLLTTRTFSGQEMSSTWTTRTPL